MTVIVVLSYLRKSELSIGGNFIINNFVNSEMTDMLLFMDKQMEMRKKHIEFTTTDTFTD